MNDQDFERLTTEKSGVSIIMEFPRNPLSNSTSITQDVKDILRIILFEYLEKVSEKRGLLC